MLPYLLSALSTALSRTTNPSEAGVYRVYAGIRKGGLGLAFAVSRTVGAKLSNLETRQMILKDCHERLYIRRVYPGVVVGLRIKATCRRAGASPTEPLLSTIKASAAIPAGNSIPAAFTLSAHLLVRLDHHLVFRFFNQ